MKPIRDPELYAGLCEIEDILENDGWIQGLSQSSDGHCLMGAISRANGLYDRTRDAVYSAIVAEAPQWHAWSPCTGVTGFNDDPETTFDDVRRVLRKARESAL